MSRFNTRTQKADLQRDFIGRGWMNFIVLKNASGTKADADAFKSEYATLLSKYAEKGVVLQTRFRIDRGTTGSIDENVTLEAWPNVKREGKQDADFRLSALTPAE